MGEHFRVFPISNWTEMDVWQYILQEQIDLPSLYFSHERDCIVRDGVILANSEYITLKPEETVERMVVRYRTCGDMPITGAVLSEANTLELIIQEVATTRTTERGTRADDKRGETAMEDRKKQGYFLVAGSKYQEASVLPSLRGRGTRTKQSHKLLFPSLGLLRRSSSQ